MIKLFSQYCWKQLVCGVLALTATISFAENSYQYNNSGLNEKQYITMKDADTHVCMITGIETRYSAADEEQIKRGDKKWRLFGGTYVEATCYAHKDFWEKTGTYSSNYWNGTAWARAVAAPSNSCQSYISLDAGYADGITYMRGFNGEFRDPGENPLPWNSYVAITQATQATISNTNPIRRAKSNIKVQMDACTSEFYNFAILGILLPIGDFTQRSRLSVGWYKAGKSNQMAKFIAANGDRVFATNKSSEFNASAHTFGSTEIGMAYVNEGACYLTYFSGPGAGSVSIKNKGGRWTLIAQSMNVTLGSDPVVIKVGARCYAYDQTDLLNNNDGGSEAVLN